MLPGCHASPKFPWAGGRQVETDCPIEFRDPENYLFCPPPERVGGQGRFAFSPPSANRGAARPKKKDPGDRRKNASGYPLVASRAGKESPLKQRGSPRAIACENYAA